MGNIPANSSRLPVQYGAVTVSTRSDPAHGYVVAREVGIVLGNSSSYRTSAATANAEKIQEAFHCMTMQAKQLGANAVLSCTLEFKQFGQNGSYAVVQCTGTAVVVAPASSMGGPPQHFESQPVQQLVQQPVHAQSMPILPPGSAPPPGSSAPPPGSVTYPTGHAPNKYPGKPS
eukprot:TRINITY_DN2061_c0_g2_i1.p1 TRINITY_DN2061_c0_g2~~TRINITY_DN2061_c0_g2_i1.p1  ORF type:complete len:174 (-),score=5.50 TRINITY_DN2061_c0_g2_i1:134-655(-)